MKKIKYNSILAILTVLFVFGAFSSCNDDLQLKTLPYLFRPVGFSATVNKTVVTFAWAAVDSAKSYTLQVSTDSLFGSKLVDTTTTKLMYTKEFAGETTFYARIRTNANDSTKNSRFNNKFSNGTYSFKTPKENIFLGYGTSNNTGNLYSAYMNDVNTLDIKWAPTSNVTHLILQSADGSVKDSVEISSTEAAAGEKVVKSLVNSNWKVQIFNNVILRGTTNGLIEGDIILTSGGDLAATLNSATAGQVILLAGGTNYTLGGAEYKFSKNVKIRSTSPVTRSIVSLTASGATVPTSTSNLMSVVAASVLDSLVFENIDFTGFTDNNPLSTKIGYMFSNKVACTLTNLKFTNCNLRNFGNTTMRLSGGTNQVIKNLSYNGCVINDIGFSSTYAIVNTNSADFVNNISFANSTIYNFKGSLVLRTGQTLNSINVTNCTINQGMQDPGSARYLMDLNTAAFTAGGGVTIKNCIFGSSGGAMGANGMRYVVGTIVTNTGSYFTSDYTDDPIPAGVTSTSIKSSMSAYSGASTALWNNPAPLSGTTAVDFTLKDTSFKGAGVAGDLRWYK